MTSKFGNYFYKNNIVILFFTGLIVTFPLLIWNFPDQEDLHTTLFSTFYYSQAIIAGEYPFWFPLLGFGTPQPFASHLIFHPLIILFNPENSRIILFLFYLIQLNFGALFVYLCCRKIGADKTPSLLGAITFLFCSTTTYSLFIKVVPVYTFVWTLLPAIIFLIIEISEIKKLNVSMCLKVLALGLVIGILMVCGHASTYAAFGMTITVFLFFIIIKKPKALFPILIATSIGLLISADKIYLLVSELRHSLEIQPDLVRASAHKKFDLFSLWSTFFKPIVPNMFSHDYIVRNVKFGNRTDPVWDTLIFFGPPYAFLTVYSVFSRKIKFKYSLSLSMALLFSVTMVVLPENIHRTLVIPAGNMVYSAPIILFSILIGSIGLTIISNKFKRKSFLFKQLIFILQVCCLIAGTIPYIIIAVKGHYHIGHVQVLNESEPIANYLKENRNSSGSRVYLSPEVTKNGPKFLSNWGGESNNTLSIWGVNQVNGYFKFTSMGDFFPSRKLGDSQIAAEIDVLNNKAMLDVLGIEYMYVLAGESWHPKLIEDGEFSKKFNIHGTNGKKLILLHNPDAWMQVTAIKTDVIDIKLPVRSECGNDALLCRDYSQLLSLKNDNIDIETTITKGGKISIDVKSSHAGVFLFVSQAYRPDWSAISKNNNIKIQRVLENFIVLDVPPDISQIELVYLPTTRIWLTFLQWGLVGIICLILLISGLICCVNYLKNKKNIKVITGNDRMNVSLFVYDMTYRRILRDWIIQVILFYVLSFLIYKVTVHNSFNLIISELIFYVTFLLGCIFSSIISWRKILYIP